MRRSWIGLTAPLCLTACLQGGVSLTPGPVKLYEGPSQPAESLAIIENDSAMFLVSIDGQSMRRWAQNRSVVTVHVLPGSRILVAQPSRRGGFESTDAVRIEFLAQAGHRYVISRRIGGGTASTTWTPVLTDMTTGKEVP